MWTLLLLAATVRSFAHMPLGISDRNNTKALNHRQIIRKMKNQQPAENENSTKTEI